MARHDESPRFLVLGASGFLGASLVSVLDDGEREVLAVSRRPAERPRERRERVRDVAADLARLGSAESLVGLLHPTHVVLVAALSRVEDCEADPDLARRMNVELPREVARGCARSRARLVLTSTDLVFGGEPPRASGYVETDPASSKIVYGRTKAEGESAVLEELPEALVVRLPLLYGSSGGRGRGASDSLLEALRRGERPRLFTDELRTPLDVRNAAEALVELSLGRERGRLHVGGPDRLSRFELGRAVLVANGRAGELDRLRETTREEAGAADRPRDVSLDSSRALGRLSVKLRSVAESLENAGSA
jgi:dTDP-4-dehydrorhamnose reductase